MPFIFSHRTRKERNGKLERNIPLLRMNQTDNFHIYWECHSIQCHAVVSIFNIVYHSKSAAECSAFLSLSPRESANVRYIFGVSVCVCFRIWHIYFFICLFPQCHLDGTESITFGYSFYNRADIYFAFRVVYNRISVICSSVVFVIFFRIRISSWCHFGFLVFVFFFFLSRCDAMCLSVLWYIVVLLRYHPCIMSTAMLYSPKCYMLISMPVMTMTTSFLIVFIYVDSNCSVYSCLISDGFAASKSLSHAKNESMEQNWICLRYIFFFAVAVAVTATFP